MTLYLSFRSDAVGGAKTGHALSGDPATPTAALNLLADADMAQQVRDKDVIFVAHGFNVPYASGARSAALLEAALGLATGNEVFVGVLWPGDFWIPVVNYPFAGGPAIDSGKHLADYCNRWLGGARSLSFVSHSLGARVVLEAVKGLKGRKARALCVTAGAVNSDCLAAEYDGARANADLTTTLASTGDHVLQLAFPLGDIFSDLFHFDHGLGTPALGYWGPKKPVPALVDRWNIPPGETYDHGDYMPPGGFPVPPPAPGVAPPWPKVARFIGRAFRGQPQSWT